MNRIILCLLYLLQVQSIIGQENVPPAWYQEELRYQVGTWTTSNTPFMNANEPMTDYLVEWKWGEHRNTLTGRLYGSINGKPTRSFWEFYQFWDPTSQQAVFQQIGQDGTVGIGFLTQDEPGVIKLVQTFTHPNGNAFRMGHLHTIIDETSYQGDSYMIDSSGRWTISRAYLWTKVPEISDSSACICCLSPFTDFDFWTGEWQVTDTAGTFLGTNQIQRHLDQCLLLENWTSGGINRGKSINYYDPSDQKWHQTWIDNQGTILHLSGGLEEDGMVMESPWQTGSKVARYKHRITWAPQSDGRVIQSWDMLDAEGQVLQTLFRGIYSKWPRVRE